MSSSKSNAKNPRKQTPGKSSGEQAKPTTVVGVGLVDTFEAYNVLSGTTVKQTMGLVTSILVKKVCEDYGVEFPKGGTNESWVFPLGVDKESPLSALPSAGPGIPPLMVFTQLQTPGPIRDRFRALTSEKEKNDADLGTLLARWEVIQKDIGDVKASYSKLEAKVQSLGASNSKLEAEVLGLKTSNKELKASNKELEAKVQSLEAVNDQQETASQNLNAELQRQKASHDQRTSELQNELTRFVNMYTPLFIRILLDEARKKVVKTEGKYNTWQEYADAFTSPAARQVDVQRITSLPANLAAYIAKSNSTARRDGNKAAHLAGKEDIWEAIMRTTTARELLESTYKYVYPDAEDVKSLI